jgi:TPR repeat protein
MHSILNNRSLLRSVVRLCRYSPKHYKHFSTLLTDLEIDAYSGKIESCVTLGQKLMDGEYGEDRIIEAPIWLEKAATKDIPRAQYLLGLYYNIPEADLPSKNYESAKEVITDIRKTTKSASKLWNDKSKHNKDKEISTSNLDGLTRSELSLHWLNQAARNGYLDAMVFLGNQYLEKGYTNKAIELYQNAGNSTPPSLEALFNLGTLYYGGSDDGLVQPDYNKSFEYFRKAAQYGDINSKYWIGYCYMNGEGGCGARDVQLGFQYIRDAADNYNHNGALYYLAMLYRNGSEELSIAHDKIKFIEYLEKSIDAGNCDAAFCYADMYLNGTDDCEQDIAKAIRLYQVSSELGSCDAALCLGSICYTGRGLDQPNLTKAFEYYNLAAERGSKEAWKNLASMYYLGEGTEKSPEIAKQIMQVVFKQNWPSPE